VGINPSSRESSPIEDLTWREQEVLALLAERLTNREIGGRLHVAETTVKSHVASIMRKLGATNRRNLVERASELGLLEAAGISRQTPQHALPADPTPFVGRARELAEIRRLLPGTRLLTLTGAGGVGKTRLALRAAAELGDAFVDGVFFAALAPVSSVERLVPAIAQAIGLPLSTDAEPLDQLISHLRRRQVLLVLDDFDNLLSEAPLVATLLERAPGVKIVATCREKLDLQAETALNVTGLSFPDREASDDPREHDAIELLLSCIHRVEPEFAAGPEDLRQLRRICELVEGMPLAIELAAGWMSVLSPAELATEVERSLDVLTSETRDMPERHRSMRAVFDQSWSRLPQPERQAFVRLSVFRGGFDRDAAQAVAGASLSSLATLVHKSFLRHDPESGRFAVHELLRQYAEQQSEMTPEVRRSAEEAHADYFADFMEQRWEHLRDRRQGAALAAIEADLENIRTAWNHRRNEGNPAEMLKFVNALWLVYWFRGWHHEGEELFRQAAGSVPAERRNKDGQTVRGLALAHRAHFKSWLGAPDEAYKLAQEAVGILEGSQPGFELALALGSLNLAADFLRNYDEGEAAARRMLDLARAQDDKWLLAFALYKVSVTSQTEGDHAPSKRLAEESMELYEELGESFASMLSLVTLGHAASALGQPEDARAIYMRGLRMSEAVGHRWGMANACKYLGQLAMASNEIAEAKAYLLRSLKIADALGMGRDQANLLCDLARVRMAEGDPQQAVELLAVVDKQPASSLHRLGGGSIRDSVQDLLAELRAGLSKERYAAAWEKGSKQAMDEAIADLLATS
jgi:predicted ATPase/DNA-binding CsgD family transcriptional regulator